MSGSIEKLEQSLRVVSRYVNDHDYIASCRPVDIKAALDEIARLRDDHGCRHAGPGRGDCFNYLGLPEVEDETTTDEYGKPHGWCWWCWKDEKLRRCEAEAARLRAEAEWVRRKLGLSEDAETTDVHGQMHILANNAHGYVKYIESHKCDDKQGEIARQAAEVTRLRERLQQAATEGIEWKAKASEARTAARWMLGQHWTDSVSAYVRERWPWLEDDDE